MLNLPQYVYWYKRKEFNQAIFERYIGNAIAGRFNLSKSYDEVLDELDNKLDGSKKTYQKNAKDIKRNLLEKFN